MSSKLFPMKDELPRGRIYYNDDGAPVKRATPRIRMKKKERRLMQAVVRKAKAVEESRKAGLVDEVLNGKA